MKEPAQILIIDDDPDICIMIKMMLEYQGYRVFTADGEKPARESLQADRVDLLIMDMLLSGADGTDLCRRFRQDQQTKFLPIIMFSAHPNARESCLAAGADQFVAKPFEMEDMLEKIRECLSLNRQVSE